MTDKTYTALDLAHLLDECCDSDGWDGGDVCEALYRLAETAMVRCPDCQGSRAVDNPTCPMCGWQAAQTHMFSPIVTITGSGDEWSITGVDLCDSYIGRVSSLDGNVDDRSNGDDACAWVDARIPRFKTAILSVNFPPPAGPPVCQKGCP